MSPRPALRPMPPPCMWDPRDGGGHVRESDALSRSPTEKSEGIPSLTTRGHRAGMAGANRGDCCRVITLVLGVKEPPWDPLGTVDVGPFQLAGSLRRKGGN